MPRMRGKRPSVAWSRIPKLHRKENQEEGPQVKRSSSPPQGVPKKRIAFIDITNAHKVHISLPGKKKKKEEEEEEAKKQLKKTSDASLSEKNHANLTKSSSVSSEGTPAAEEEEEEEEWEEEEWEEEAEVEEEEEDEAAAQTVVEAPADEPVAAAPPAGGEVPAHLQKQQVPVEFDIDSEYSGDCDMCPEYAKDIFDYLKRREENFILWNYMPDQSSLTPEMRAALIDWLVEVQENFELYHETLYLAVKMADHYLAKTPVHRVLLQLVGSTAMLIASKFEESSPPCVDDFLYICDDAYKREEIISMEATILQTLSFDISIPISYRFLRRYANCVSSEMDTLTLARFYCEMSLMEMELVAARGSLLASACLLLALVTRGLGGWGPVLQYHSGYRASDLAPVARKLHEVLSAPPNDKLRAIRNKYSHKVFFEVATLPMVSRDVLEEALSQ